MDYTALFLIFILATTQSMSLHRHCNYDVHSSASGLQELTTLQYCLTDNCTIIRYDTGQQLDIVYITQSHLVVTTTDGQISTMLVSKNDPELFCFTPNSLSNSQMIITAVVLTLISLSSGYIAVLHLLFKELRTVFGKLIIIYNIATALRTLDILIMFITHIIAVYAIMPCYLLYFVFMQLLMLSEGSATCITAYLAYVMHQSCRSREIKYFHKKQFYKSSVNYIFGSLLLLDILIFSYDFGTGTFQKVILANGHCSSLAQMEYGTVKIAQTYTIISKIIQATAYFVYHYQLKKALRMVNTLALNVDHKQSRLYYKLAATMAATIGISQFFFAYIIFIDFATIIGIVGTFMLLIQQCVIIALFTSSKKISKLPRDFVLQKHLCNMNNDLSINIKHNELLKYWNIYVCLCMCTYVSIICE